MWRVWQCFPSHIFLRQLCFTGQVSTLPPITSPRRLHAEALTARSWPMLCAPLRTTRALAGLPKPLLAVGPGRGGWVGGGVQGGAGQSCVIISQQSSGVNITKVITNPSPNNTRRSSVTNQKFGGIVIH